MCADVYCGGDALGESFGGVPWPASMSARHVGSVVVPSVVIDPGGKDMMHEIAGELFSNVRSAARSWDERQQA